MPDQVPMHRPTSIGQSFLASSPSAPPCSICQMLVTKDGSSMIAAAWVGGMTMASRPMEMVGRPKPTMPLAKPASAKAAATSRRSETVMRRTCAKRGGLAMRRFQS